MREGLDYSWHRLSAAAIKQAGRDFVVRYLFDDGQGGKGLDASEVAELKRGGIDIAVVYEEYANSFRGYQAGVNQAHRAQAALNKLDLAKDLPIYFAVDWDSSEADQAAINAALEGAASVIGLARVGVYGSFYVMNRSRGRATWFWQTYAWSGGQVADNIHLYQYKNGQTLAGGAVDYTRALKSQFGQSGVSGAPAPTPTPTPVPTPTVVGKYTVVKDDNLSKIADKFGISWQALYAYGNNRAVVGSNPNVLKVGQVLDVPSGTPSSSAPAAGKYTIQSGENLSVIAARYGWSWQQLYNYGGNRATVGSNPNVVKAGQVLDVPGGSAAPVPAPSVKTYTVRSDDNLSSIAAKYGLTWQQVYNYGNNKAVIGGNPDLIKVGQVLQIPA